MGDPMTDTIKVISAKTDGNTVLLWERHPNHPGGEVYIIQNGKSHQVHPTVQVNRLLSTGLLVKVQQEPEDEPETEPVEGYDEMTAAAIIEMAAELDDHEKAVFAGYESRHKNRKTVLEALQ